jgi:asparagine synthase (glutamine-hydrolysing)
MCGIAGIMRIQPAGAAPEPEVAIQEDWLDLLDASIAHRGPDGHGRFRDRAVRANGDIVDVALVHRRLSIIDHAGGHQPMVRIDPWSGGRIAVVFNGCIYNHRDLRRELASSGSRFESDHSDTEVIVEGWRRWREGVFNRLVGMFAITVWDSRDATLAHTRDDFGEKPLYILNSRRGEVCTVAFSSVPSAFSSLSRLLGTPEHEVVRGSDLIEWLRYGARACPPRYGTTSVPPGSVWVYNGGGGGYGGASPRPMPEDTEPIPTDLDDVLRHAVHSRVEADVPLGCFLSGGIDSGLVASYAKEVLPELRTFTVRMPDTRYDESEAAAATAKVLGTRHTTLDVDANPADDLVHLIRQLGLPFGDSSLLPTYWVCRAAAREVKVCLGGDGGDELFGGYERYRAVRWLRLARLLRPLAAISGEGSNPRSLRSKFARLADAAAHDGYADLLSIFPSSMLARLMPGQTPAESWPVLDGEDAIAVDTVDYLPNDLLRKTDTASMAVPIEVRSPLLDPAVARLGLWVAPLSIVLVFRSKESLRELAEARLGDDIADRPKMGFAIPIGEWFRSDYGGMRTLLMDHLNQPEPFGEHTARFDMRYVRRLIDEHMSGRRDHSQRLYMLLVLSIWSASSA